MLKKVKEKNETLIREHFQEVFGENYDFEVKWGIPVTLLTITFEKETTKSIWKLAFNMEDETYELSTFATKMVEEKEVPDWSTIDKNTIDFIIKRTAEISEQLFITREVPEQPQQEVNPEIEADIEKVEAEQVE